MKVSILAVLGFYVVTCLAEDTLSVYKNWKKFRSDYGFELKYPSCWILRGDGPDEAILANSSSKDIAIEETNECQRPRMDKSVPNGISAYADPVRLKSKEEGPKTIALVEKHAANNIARNVWKAYKRVNSVQGGVGYFYVENEVDKFHPYIRWHLELYCPDRKISFIGPMVERPSKTFDEKFKSGDLALPEPEKTIYESVKCTEPKLK